MNKAPAFQFYAADWLADANVQMLTGQEEGHYIRLLAYCWREGSIPRSSAKLSLLCKGEEVSTNVQHLFEIDPCNSEQMLNNRLDAERRKQEEYRNKKSLSGIASGKSRRNKSLDAEHPFNFVRTKTNSSIFSLQSSSSSSIEEESTSKPTPAPSALVPIALWISFVEMRKKIRKPLTEDAAVLIRRKLEAFSQQGHDPIGILEESVMNSWSGVFLPKEKKYESSQERRSSSSANAIDSVLGRIAQAPRNIHGALPPAHK